MRKFLFLISVLFSLDGYCEVKYSLLDNASPRFDGAKSYLVLIDPVNLNAGEYKTDIQNVLISISKKLGTKKFSVRIFDKKEALENYQEFHIGKKGKLIAKENERLIEIHLVATYVGNLSTNWAPYTLSYFPSAFSDHSKIGKYVDTVEFEPEI